jgi:hypothetical protein
MSVDLAGVSNLLRVIADGVTMANCQTKKRSASIKYLEDRFLVYTINALRVGRRQSRI